jgi:hypothetical protein
MFQIDARLLPVAQFGGVGAAAIAARDKRRLGGRDAPQPLENVLAGGMGGVALRPDQHEIVVHHVQPAGTVALGKEFLLGRLVVHELDVGIAAPAQVERLPGTHRHHAHLDPGLLLVDRQQVAEQAALLGRRGRCDGDELFLRQRGARQQRGRQCSAQHPGARFSTHAVSPCK